MKKGQVTIFVTIGIIIFVAFLLILIVRNVAIRNALFGENIDPNVLPVKNYVESCIESVGNSGLRLMGLQGGRVFLREGSYLDTGSGKIYYGYINGNILLPQLNSMEFEFNAYMKEGMDKCIEDFIPLREQGKEISYGEREFSTNIKQDKVIVDLRWPIVFVKGGKEFKISDFSKEFKFSLGKMRSISEDIVKENPEWVNFNTLSKYDVNVTVFPYDSDLVYLLSDENYDFMFGVR